MSIKLMAEVWTRNLPHAEQSILLALADHADDEGGSVFPSVGLVAWKTGYSTRQVQRIIRKLEVDGALTLVKTAVRYRANEYRIDLEAVAVKAPLRGDNMSSLDETGVTSTPSGVTTEAPGVTQLGHPRGDTAMSPRTTSEPSSEPPLESHTLLAEQFASMIEQNTGRNPKVDRSWVDTFRKLEVIDGYDIDTIQRVITWGCADPFWSQVLLSAPRLRVKKNGVMKFEQVRVSMVGTIRNQPGLSTAMEAEALRRVGR